MAKGDLIFDRTQEDVINETSKGFINASDLNRIGQNTKDLNDALVNYGYTVGKSHTYITNWRSPISETTEYAASTRNIPQLSLLTAIITNIQDLLDTYFVYPTTPVMPYSLEYATVDTFNAIEKNLYDMYTMIESMESNFVECDTFYCGEEYR